MEAQIKLGRVFGVQIGLHYSWLIIASLITLSLASHFRMTNAHWGSGVIWATAILTGMLFFAAIIAHELSHAAVALASRPASARRSRSIAPGMRRRMRLEDAN
jgi:Zn-dependent protease